MGSMTVYCIYILWPSNVVTVWDFVCIYSSYTWYDEQIQCYICNNMDNKYYTILCPSCIPEKVGIIKEV